MTALPTRFLENMQLHGYSPYSPKTQSWLLLHSANAVLQRLAWDPRYAGGRLTMLGVLPAWTRAMLQHPHLHLLVKSGVDCVH